MSGNEMCKSGCSNGLDYSLREEGSQAILGVGWRQKEDWKQCHVIPVYKTQRKLCKRFRKCLEAFDFYQQPQSTQDTKVSIPKTMFLGTYDRMIENEDILLDSNAKSLVFTSTLNQHIKVD